MEKIILVMPETMITGGDVKEPERMKLDDGRLMSLSRVLIAIFSIFLFAFFLAKAFGVTVIYPSVSNAELRCYFVTAQGRLFPAEKLFLGFKGYIICNLLKNDTLYIYANTVSIENDTYLISLPPEDEYICYNLSDNLSFVSFLDEEIKSSDIVFPLQFAAKKFCIYNYSYFLQTYLIQFLRAGNSLKIWQIGSSSDFKEFVVPNLSNSYFEIGISKIYGKSTISFPFFGPIKILYNSLKIPSSLLLSINGSLPVPLEIFREYGFQSLKVVQVYPVVPANVSFEGYSELVRFPKKLIVPLTTIKVNGYIVTVQKAFCSIYVLPEGPFNDCEYASSYEVTAKTPEYKNYYLTFTVIINPQFVPLRNVSIVVYRNGRVYVSYHYSLILKNPVNFSVIVPYDGSGLNDFRIVVKPSNLEAKSVDLKVMVPNPVPEVVATVEIRKSYGKMLLATWFLLTLIILIILVTSQPRFKL